MILDCLLVFVRVIDVYPTGKVYLQEVLEGQENQKIHLFLYPPET